MLVFSSFLTAPAHNMLYSCLKIFHILCATLFLTSLSYCIYLWVKIPHLNETAVERIQLQTWSIILPIAILQLTTGFTMISVQHYDPSLFWVKGSVIGFIILGLTWFTFIYSLLSQKKISRTLQFFLLVLCLITLLNMIFFMVNKI